jgi:hypothetical protein
VKELHLFLGFAWYYRMHVKDLLLTAGRLYKLLHSLSVAFKMMVKRTQVYHKLKTAFMSAPLLFHPNPFRPFKLYVDACLEGIGAALHEIQIVTPQNFPDCG